MSGEKCCICGEVFRKGQIAVRILVEAVSRHEDDSDEVETWSNTRDWTMLHQVHLTCVVKENNRGNLFEYGRELNMLPLDEILEECNISKPVIPPLRLVRS